MKNQKVQAFNSDLVFMNWNVVGQYVSYKTLLSSFLIKAENKIKIITRKKGNAKTVILLAHEFEIFRLNFILLRFSSIYSQQNEISWFGIKEKAPNSFQHQACLNKLHLTI